MNYGNKLYSRFTKKKKMEFILRIHDKERKHKQPDQPANGQARQKAESLTGILPPTRDSKVTP